MQNEDALAALAELPTFRQPVVSNGGGEVALCYDVTGRHELHVLDVETGDTEQWTDGDLPRHGRAGLRWGADDDRVFFRRDDAGDERFDVYAVDRGGIVEPVFEVDGSAGVQDAGDGGERLLLGVTPDGQSHSDLYGLDLTTGEATRLTDHGGPTGGAAFSPDGDRIAYGTENPDDGSRDVYVADADGSNPRRLSVGGPGSKSYVLDWHPGGGRLLVRDGGGEYERPGVHDLGTDSTTWFGGGYDERPRCFLPGGDRFVATRLRGVVTVPVVYGLATDGSRDDGPGDGRGDDGPGADRRDDGPEDRRDDGPREDYGDEEPGDDRSGDAEGGESREFDVPDGVTWFGWTPVGRYAVDDDRVLVVHAAPTRRPELLVYDLRTDEHEVALAAEYGPFSPSDFAGAEHVTFESNGVPDATARAVAHDPGEEFEIDALLWDAGERPSPLVVYPHGGPYARDAMRFDVHAQFLALGGYSVLQVNYRGSAGRGRSFRDALSGDWGGAEQGDVAAGVEHVVDRHGWLDADRVAVFGRSYGGYSAYWQLVQYPDLYDAGVAAIGMTDLADMYENSTLREWLVEHLGTPGENPGLYEERSPATHAGNLDAPLLVVHGVNDPRVPVSQARRFRAALAAAGYEEGETADFEYVELGGEGHGSADADHRTRTFELLDDFLGRRLTG